MKSIYKLLASTMALAAMSINMAWAVAPPGKLVTTYIALQGGSSSAAKWFAPSSMGYKVHVFVPKNGTVVNSIYRVYPNGKKAGSTKCLSTDATYPCYEVTVDQTQHKNAWAQLMLNGDPQTQWTFAKAKGYVAAVADNLGVTTTLNISTQIRFEDGSPPPNLAIGDTYQGGIVFYIDGATGHGLIAAPIDQSAGIKWYNGLYNVTDATGTAVGTGQGNTTKIIAAQGAGNYAAQLADSLVISGYSDWYLPSKEELNLMYTNIGQGAPAPLTNVGGFAGTYYWSSSEDSYSKAWLQYFGSGIQNLDYAKDYGAAHVRAVRAF